MAKGVGFYKSDWFKMKEGKDLVYESIIRILMTSRKERVMRPDFGVGLNRSLFETITPDLLQDIAVTIHNAVSVYEQKVTVVDVQTELRQDENLIKIHVFMTYNDSAIQKVEELTLNYNL